MARFHGKETMLVTSKEPSEALKRLLERHQVVCERLFQELGDPEEACSAFVRATYDTDVLEEVFLEMIKGGIS